MTPLEINPIKAPSNFNRYSELSTPELRGVAHRTVKVIDGGAPPTV